MGISENVWSRRRDSRRGPADRPDVAAEPNCQRRRPANLGYRDPSRRLSFGGVSREFRDREHRILRRYGCVGDPESGAAGERMQPAGVPLRGARSTEFAGATLCSSYSAAPDWRGRARRRCEAAFAQPYRAGRGGRKPSGASIDPGILQESREFRPGQDAGSCKSLAQMLFILSFGFGWNATKYVEHI